MMDGSVLKADAMGDTVGTPKGGEGSKTVVLRIALPCWRLLMFVFGRGGRA